MVGSVVGGSVVGSGVVVVIVVGGRVVAPPTTLPTNLGKVVREAVVPRLNILLSKSKISLKSISFSNEKVVSSSNFLLVVEDTVDGGVVVVIGG